LKKLLSPSLYYRIGFLNMASEKFRELGIYSMTNTLPLTVESCFEEIERVREREKELFNRLKALAGGSLKLEKFIVEPSVESCFETHGSFHQSPKKLSQQKTHANDMQRSWTVFSDGMLWGSVCKQVTMKEDDRTSPLIDALKRVEYGYKDYDEIAKWCSELARIFSLYDENNNDNLDEDEYVKMINDLPLSEGLRNNLSHKFPSIDIDNSGCITFKEFLFYFLSFPPLRNELANNIDSNEPYRNTFDLSELQKFRLWIYKVVTIPDFNWLSKLLYCSDILLTLIPFCILYLQLFRADIDSANLTVL